MKTVIGKTETELANIGAGQIAQLIQRKPAAVIGLATGASPVCLYDRLVELYEQGEIDFSQVRFFNLDEYCGLAPDHPQSYCYFLHHHLLDRVNVQPQNVQLQVIPADRDRAQIAAAYEQAVEAAGGVDLQILGIGGNGHIGFNEPDETFSESTHFTRLTPETMAANKRFFADDETVPAEAITMGIGTIMNAREIVLIATGAQKAQAVRDALEGPVSPHCPASILQQHDNVTFLLDEAAAAQIPQQ